MKKAFLLLVIGLGLGAVAMYVGTHFRFEMVPNTEPKSVVSSPPAPESARSILQEPEPLPKTLQRPNTNFAGDRGITPASFTLPILLTPAVIGQAEGSPPPLEIKEFFSPSKELF